MCSMYANTRYTNRILYTPESRNFASNARPFYGSARTRRITWYLVCDMRADGRLLPTTYRSGRQPVGQAPSAHPSELRVRVVGLLPIADSLRAAQEKQYTRY